MAGDELEIVDGAEVGAWSGPELGGRFGAVSSQVPKRYPAYARILHSVTIYEERSPRVLTWAEVATVTGRRVHPEVQWHALVGSADSLNFSDALWDEGSPDRGDLGAATLASLLESWRRFTVDPGHCFFAVWAGYSWGSFGFALHEEDGRTWTESWQGPERSTRDLSWRFPADQVARPWLELSGREYTVLAGPLDAAARIAGTGEDDGAEEEAISPNSPQMFWPADRTWFVASEIDFDSTLVAGSEELITAILASPRLEAWPVIPDSSLASDADRINPVLDS